MEFLGLSINFWVILGLFGQFLFFLRFVVQWVHSERKKASTIPIHFWYLSLLGGMITLIYAIYLHDAVFIIGNIAAILIYTRNLVFMKKINAYSSTET